MQGMERSKDALTSSSRCFASKEGTEAVNSGILVFAIIGWEDIIGKVLLLFCSQDGVQLPPVRIPQHQ